MTPEEELNQLSRVWNSLSRCLDLSSKRMEARTAVGEAIACLESEKFAKMKRDAGE